MLHALYFTLLKFSYPRISGDTFFLFDFPTFFLEAQHLKDEELTPPPPFPATYLPLIIFMYNKAYVRYALYTDKPFFVHYNHVVQIFYRAKFCHFSIII